MSLRGSSEVDAKGEVELARRGSKSVIRGSRSGSGKKINENRDNGKLFRIYVAHNEISSPLVCPYTRLAYTMSYTNSHSFQERKEKNSPLPKQNGKNNYYTS